jgi:hypothetical protein
MFVLKFLRRNVFWLLIVLIIIGNGCGNSNKSSSKNTTPDRKTGGLYLQIHFVDNSSIVNKTSANEIVYFKIKLIRTDESLVIEKEFEYGTNEATFDSLYPGEWEVSVSGLDNAGNTIFYGSQVVNVESGAVKEVQITVIPAPGVLDVTFDASRIINSGITVTKGTFYIYLDPATNNSTSHLMTLNENLLKVNFSVPEGTFQVKLAIPNLTTKGAFISNYYRVDIEAGETTTLTIAPDGSLSAAATIDSTPATPTNLSVAYQRETSTVSLSWSAITDSDLNGYRVYRTNIDGRFVRLISIDAGTTGATDPITSSLFYNKKIGYAVSSFDEGGNESLWSDSVYITQ